MNVCLPAPEPLCQRLPAHEDEAHRLPNSCCCCRHRPRPGHLVAGVEQGGQDRGDDDERIDAVGRHGLERQGRGAQSWLCIGLRWRVDVRGVCVCV